MSQALLQTKKRMKSVGSISKITRAMKLVSSVKLRSQMKKMLANKLYDNEMIRVIKDIFSSGMDTESIYASAPKTGKKLYIVITSTLGLCGAYNFNLFKCIDKTITKKDDVILFGEKGWTHYQNSKFRKIDRYRQFGSEVDEEVLNDLSRYVLDAHISNTYEEISIIYTQYVNSITFVPSKMVILPIDEGILNSEKSLMGPLIEPSQKEVIEAVIPLYVTATLYAKIIEAEVSEQASRRNAMEASTDNADELLSHLKLEYNKARQSSITQEIIEVVGASKVNQD
jgi:F-type H+-transporting ATPase subunit gamma